MFMAADASSIQVEHVSRCMLPLLTNAWSAMDCLLMYQTYCPIVQAMLNDEDPDIITCSVIGIYSLFKFYNSKTTSNYGQLRLHFAQDQVLFHNVVIVEVVS